MRGSTILRFCMAHSWIFRLRMLMFSWGVLVCPYVSLCVIRCLYLSSPLRVLFSYLEWNSFSSFTLWRKEPTKTTGPDIWNFDNEATISILLRTTQWIGNSARNFGSRPRKPVQDSLTTIEAKKDADYYCPGPAELRRQSWLSKVIGWYGSDNKTTEILWSKSTSSAFGLSAKAEFINELCSP